MTWRQYCARAKKTDSCLSKEQLKAVKTYYEGPKDSKGNPLYYGFPFGGETGEGGWSLWVTGGLKYHEDTSDYQEGLGSDFPAPVVPNAQYPFGTNVMKYLIYHDPDWTYKNYDFDTFRQILSWQEKPLMPPILTCRHFAIGAAS